MAFRAFVQKTSQLSSLALLTAVMAVSSSAMATFGNGFSLVHDGAETSQAQSEINDFIPEVLARDYEQARENLIQVDGQFDPQLAQRLMQDPTFGYQVVAIVDVSAQGSSPTSQTIHVFKLDGGHFRLVLNWKVSTGLNQPFSRNGVLVSHRITRPGYYRAEYLSKDYVSQSCHEGMPYSVFYDRAFGTAIHATSPAAYSRLGQRASFGCTRLTYDEAKEFFELVTSTGFGPIIKFDPFPPGRKATPELAAVGVPQVVQGYRAMVINTNPSDRNAVVTLQTSEIVKNPDLLFSVIHGKY